MFIDAQRLNVQGIFVLERVDLVHFIQETSGYRQLVSLIYIQLPTYQFIFHNKFQLKAKEVDTI